MATFLQQPEPRRGGLRLLLVLPLMLWPTAGRAAGKTPLFRVGRATVWKSGSGLLFRAGLAIDADGAPRAYRPKPGRGLDDLPNAGRPGHWWAIVTRNGRPSGQPVVQGRHDPAPGYYVSSTALVDPDREPQDPRAYVDASRVPYVVLPPQARRAGARLGDFAVALVPKTGRHAFALFADIGPREKLGEGSIALARALGIPSSPREGGAEGGVVYLVFPGSGNGRPRPLAVIRREGQRRLAAWGGLERLRRVLP
jgi:hypothetical protein